MNVPPQAKTCVFRQWNWRSIVTTVSGAIRSAIRVSNGGRREISTTRLIHAAWHGPNNAG
jgi:hypothetical protein